jgi:ferredoxin
LEVDWARCTGHLVCAELLPELVIVDDWGYPMLPRRAVPDHLLGHARRARAACPVMALHLLRLPAGPGEAVSPRADG